MSTNENKMADSPMEIENNAETALHANEHGFRDKMFNHFKDGEFCDVTLEVGKDKIK